MTFYYNSDKTVFECPLVVSACTAIDEHGHVCGKQTLVEPLCPAHLAHIFGVGVRVSSIPNAGFGLFALRDIRKKDLITPPYTGVVHTADSINALYKNGSAPYALGINSDMFVDAACQRSWAAFINHTGMTKSNAKFAIWAAQQTANIRATKDIKAGSEILLHYGKNYFRFNDNVHTRTVYTAVFAKEMQNVFSSPTHLAHKRSSSPAPRSKQKRSKSPTGTRSNPIVV
jgi:SET domain